MVMPAVGISRAGHALYHDVDTSFTRFWLEFQDLSVATGALLIDKVTQVASRGEYIRCHARVQL